MSASWRDYSAFRGERLSAGALGCSLERSCRSTSLRSRSVVVSQLCGASPLRSTARTFTIVRANQERAEGMPAERVKCDGCGAVVRKRNDGKPVAHQCSGEVRPGYHDLVAALNGINAALKRHTPHLSGGIEGPEHRLAGDIRSMLDVVGIGRSPDACAFCGKPMSRHTSPCDETGYGGVR